MKRIIMPVDGSEKQRIIGADEASRGPFPRPGAGEQDAEGQPEGRPPKRRPHIRPAKPWLTGDPEGQGEGNRRLILAEVARHLHYHKVHDHRFRPKLPRR
jgi:hypothetical protein